MKRAIRRLARGLGYEIARLDSLVEIDSPWGPNILLYALRDLAARRAEPLKIVQIGAHDGSDQDPLRAYLAAHDCRALLIEPMDVPYAALAQRYADVPGVHVLQTAISDRNGAMEMHYIADERGEPDLTLFSSLDRGTVERNLRSRGRPSSGEYRILSREIAVRTLRSVLEEHRMEDPDAVVLDTEGFDARIVKDFLNDGVEPKVIRFEYCNLSRRDFGEVRALLVDRGYEIVRSGIDIYCQKAGLLR